MGAILRLFEQGSADCLYETNVFSASFTRALSKSIEWSASLPLKDELYDILADSLRAEIWYDANYGISGKVQSFDINYDSSPSIELKGREEIDAMFDIGADTSLYLSSKLYVIYLFTLLNRAGWRFGSYRDIDRTKVVTLDLRDNQKTLLTQFGTLLKEDPDLLYRFGGYDYTGQPMLDISIFEDQEVGDLQMPSDREFTNGLMLQGVKTNDKFTDRIYAADVKGGNVTDSGGVKRSITLADAISNDPTKALDANYPIFEDVSEVSFSVLPTKEGPIGGVTKSSPSTAITNVAIGDIGGTGLTSYWVAFIFHPYPGTLSEISFWTAAITASIETNKATNPILWQIREVDESNVLSNTGILIASGTLDSSLWTSNVRVRHTLPAGITVSSTKRYMYRIGLQSPPATSATLQLRVSGTNNSETFRVDRSAGIASATNTSLNYQPMFEARTNGTVSSKGMKLVDIQARFVPAKTETNATLAETNSAGAALYAWIISTLQARDQDLHTIEVDSVGTDFSLKPGDNLLVRAKAQFIKGARDEWEYRKIETVQYDMKDGRVETHIKFSSNRPDSEVDDPSIALYDQQKEKTQTPDGKIITPLYEWVLTEISQLVQNTVADTTLSDGTPAVTVSVTVPAATAGFYDTRIIGTPYATHSTVLIPVVVELVQKPTSSAPTTLIVKLGVKNKGWTVYDSCTLMSHIVWR